MHVHERSYVFAFAKLPLYLYDFVHILFIHMHLRDIHRRAVWNYVCAYRVVIKILCGIHVCVCVSMLTSVLYT